MQKQITKEIEKTTSKQVQTTTTEKEKSTKQVKTTTPFTEPPPGAVETTTEADKTEPQVVSTTTETQSVTSTKVPPTKAITKPPPSKTSTMPPKDDPLDCVRDVLFLLDSTNSVPDAEYEKMKQFVKNVIERFDVDQDELRVSLFKMHKINTSVVHQLFFFF